MEAKSLDKGSLMGGILLVAGSAIGAGMLGLPIVTGSSGFLPAIVVFFFSWLFMTTTALLLLEVNLSIGKNTNFLSMAKKSLGLPGKVISWCIYLFLFYSMLIAYIDASGSLTAEFFAQTLHLRIEQWQGSLFFTLLFGVFVYLGTLFVDQLNRVFMLGLVLTYLLLLIFGSMRVDDSLLMHQGWRYSYLAIPVVISSFGYHNVLPTLTNYLKNDRKKMIWVVVGGGGIPLLIYTLWDWLILGTVPFTMFEQHPTFEKILLCIQHPMVSVLAQYFAFFAIVTSFLAQALSLLDFLRDALKVKNSKKNRLVLTLLVLMPPFFFALNFPGIFVKALGYVGGFAAIIIFVLFPAMMVWELRYKRREMGYKIIPGGRPVLFGVIVIGVAIMVTQFLIEYMNIKF